MHARAELRYALARPSTGSPAALWLRRMWTRHRLAELDARQLDDVGLSELERARECAKWFWQA
jgi:uncharacterized protein YjiS (DUF1127 family)